MGILFRKSFNFGPFRLNLSKSGIGWSFGTKGIRYTKTAKGNSYGTFGIPGTGVSGNVFLGDCAIVDFPEEIVSLVRTDAWLKLSINTEMTCIMMSLLTSEIISVYIEISVVTIAEERKTLSDIMVIKLVSKPTTIPKTNISNTDDTTFGFDIEIHAFIIKIIVIELIHLFSERVIINIGREVVKFPVFE